MMWVMPLPNLFLDDLTLCPPAELQQGIVSLARSGVEEKFRLDFKERWDPDKQCPDIVAFANTYGGLLALGVANDRSSFPGIETPPQSDLKTQIASVIATRINPVPIFEVHTCPAPGDPDHALALIRVVAQPKIHMYLKGDKPVYVRNEDQTVPARAAELRALLERMVNAQGRDPYEARPSFDVAPGVFVTKAANLSLPAAERANSAHRTRSETFCEITAIPERPLRVRLDSILEQLFVEAIYRTYLLLPSASIKRTDDRARSWYRYNHLDLGSDHELTWAFDNTGIIRFISECSCRVPSDFAGHWSLVDFFINLDGTLRLVHEMWSIFDHFGAGRLRASLFVPGLAPLVSNSRSNYPPCFYEVNYRLPFEDARRTAGDYEVSSGVGEASIGYDSRTSQRSETLVELGNQVLRDLRFAVDLTALRESLGHLPQPT
jgi:hypothetical protein